MTGPAPLLRVLALLLMTIGALACSGGSGVRIGVKPFVEQEILGAVIEGALDTAGVKTRPMHRCDDTFECERALQEGYIDVMVEYTGTALHLLGEPLPEDGDAIGRLSTLYEPLGIRWLASLGYENGYEWLVPAAKARSEALRTMSDLAEHDTPLRIACPPEYLRRPRDGLDATARRYGLRVADEPLVIADPAARYRAVIEGKADVAVGYETDGPQEGLALVALRDDLSFFPPYAATILVRGDTLEEEPGLARALGRLEGRFDASRMRALNNAVSLEGETVAGVAARVLAEEGLLEEPTRGKQRRARLAVAVDEEAEAVRLRFGPPVVAALREVFVGRAVTVSPEPDPVEAVLRGQARFAIIGAEAFFEVSRGKVERRSGVEALAVLGERVLHRLAAPTIEATPDASASTVVVGLPEGAARMLRETWDAPGETVADLDAALAALQDGSASVAAVLAPRGDPGLVQALQDGRARIVPTPAPSDAVARQRFALPYLHRERLPAGTYPGQDEAIETLSSQVLLAAPSRDAMPQAAAGPAGALPGAGPPPTLAQIEALVAAVGTGVAPDPSVPSAFALTGGPREAAPDRAWLDSLLNFGVLAFCGWLLVITAAPVRPQ